jgi:hypothetical protein
VRRRLFNLGVLLSLVLCLGTVLLWVRSERVYESIHWHGRDWGRDIGTDDGILVYSEWHAPVDLIETPAVWKSQKRFPQPRRFGMERYNGAVSGAVVGNAWAPWFPLWLPAILTALMPGMWLYSLVRRRRQFKLGQCSHCGYSLTGNTSGVCPECGTPAADKAGAKA